MRKRYLIFTVITIVLVIITAGMTIQKERYTENWQPPRRSLTTRWKRSGERFPES